MPEREKAIGRRLREARERHMAQRFALAGKLGIGTERLASYESGRAALPWWVGERFCDLLDIGQTWLATGDGGWDHYMPVKLDPEPPPQLWFSEAHDKHFLPQRRATWDALSVESGQRTALGLKLRAAVYKVIREEKVNITPADNVRIMAALAAITKRVAAAQKKPQKGDVP